MSCAQCGTPLPAEAASAQRYCDARCRNRFNNAQAKSRPVQAGEHGTRTGYARGCRCDTCKEYNANYSRLVRARQPKRPRKRRSDLGTRKVVPRPEDHGTTSMYAYRSCRCIDCRKAASDYNRKWREANRERYRAAMTEFRLRNPHKVRGYSAARAAQPFDDEAIAYREVIRRDPCAYCGAPCEAIDHIKAVSTGGTSRWSNLAPACASCNAIKGAKPLLAFLLYRLR